MGGFGISGSSNNGDGGNGDFFSSMANLLGIGLQTAGSVKNAQDANAGAAAAANMSEQAKAWTQLLGLMNMDRASPDYAKALADYKDTTGKLPGVAREGEKKALGQLSGAESSGIQQIMSNQATAQGGVGQSAASRGFYGSSIQGGQSNQVRQGTNQSIGDLMAKYASAKSGVMQQGTQNLMSGLLAKASGQMAAGQGMYGMAMDKNSWLLNTGNQFGTDTNQILAGQQGNANYGGMTTGPLAKFGAIPGQAAGPGGGGGGGSSWYDPSGWNWGTVDPSSVVKDIFNPGSWGW